jgi:hypothetical protein
LGGGDSSLASLRAYLGTRALMPQPIGRERERERERRGAYHDIKETMRRVSSRQ